MTVSVHLSIGCLGQFRCAFGVLPFVYAIEIELVNQSLCVQCTEETSIFCTSTDFSLS